MPSRAFYRQRIDSPVFKKVKFPKMPDNDPSELLAIIRLGAEDEAEKAREKLILSYVLFACSIASRFAVKNPAKSRDILSVALTTLVEYVEANAKENLDKMHFIRKMHVRISGAVKLFLMTDQVVKAQPTSAWFQAYYKQVGTAAYDPITNMHNYDDAVEPKIDSIIPKGITVQLGTTKDQQEMEMRDLLHHRAISDVERLVIKESMDGTLDADIAVKIGKSRQRVSQIRKEAITKLRCIVTGRW